MAVGLADLHNIAIIPTYAHYIYNELPMKCWGSKEKVKEWLNNKEAKND